MRLLNIKTLQLRSFTDADKPRYAIISHRWYREELTKQELESCKKESSLSYKKIKALCRFVSRWSNNLEWIWIDTCYIDSTNNAELTEAINSMFRWYSDAAVCLAYLWDIPARSGYEDEFAPSGGNDTIDLDRRILDDLHRSEWFRRGWTLQELLAPALVVFLDEQRNVLGHKFATAGPLSTSNGYIGPVLNDHIAEITGIPPTILVNHDLNPESADYTDVIVRLSWMRNRHTMRAEDRAYCLLGLCGIYMTLIYGERDNAMVRLHNKIRKRYPAKASPDTSGASSPAHHSPDDDLSNSGPQPEDSDARGRTEHNSAIRTSIEQDRLRRSGLLSTQQIEGMLVDDLLHDPHWNWRNKATAEHARAAVAQRLAYVSSLPLQERRMRWAKPHL
jgi:hypothetical protein